jgi:hypothetical protein
MHSRDRLCTILFAAAVCAIASAWLHARMMANNDRPPIIVRGGSIYFQGGDPNGPNGTDCCNNWKKDLLSDEWKPEPDDKHGVTEYSVTVTGVPSTVCSMTEVAGEKVLIYFQHGSERNRDFSLYRFYVHPKFGFGKREPKLIPAGRLTVKNSSDPKQPGVLEDDRPGFISGIRVDGAACGFDESYKPSLVIRIQPKSE